MQPLQPVSIKLVIWLLGIRFIKASSVLADLSAVGSFPQWFTFIRSRVFLAT